MKGAEGEKGDMGMRGDAGAKGNHGRIGKKVHRIYTSLHNGCYYFSLCLIL